MWLSPIRVSRRRRHGATCNFNHFLIGRGFLGNLCDSSTTTEIPPGNYSVRLTYAFGNHEALLPEVPVTISSGTTSEVAFDVSSVVGLVSGNVTLDGQPPPSEYGVCGSTNGQACAGVGQTGGAFKLLLPAGPGTGFVYAGCQCNSLKTFTFDVVAGQATAIPSVNVETGGALHVAVTYQGQPPSATGATCNFNHFLIGRGFLGNLCDSSTTTEIPPGNYSVRLAYAFGNHEALLPEVPVTISSGTTSEVAFDVSSVVGLVSGNVTLDGQPPPSEYGVCGSTNGQACAGVGQTGGAFKLLLPAGPGTGFVYAGCQCNSLKTFTFDVVAGHATDLGNPLATLASIAVTPADTTIPKGTTQQFTATGTYSDASTADLTSSVTWSSSDVGVATITSTGLATGLVSGITNISATSDSTTGSTSLTVEPAPPLDDTAPPQLLEFSLSPNAVDSSAGSATITFDAHITDDISGLEQADITFRSPSGQTVVAHFRVYERISGTSLDGVYRDVATLPQFSEHGTWTATQGMYLRDQVGNTHNLTRSEMASIGLPTTFEVAGPADTAPPQLLEFSLSPNAVDSSAGSATITFDAHITDDISGLEQADITFRSPSGQTVVAHFRVYERISGTSLDGVYRDVATLPQFSEHGTWTATQGMYLRDQVGNTHNLTRSEMASIGLPTTFHNGPTLTSIALTPADPTIPKGTTQQFSATGTYTDATTADVTSLVTWSSSDTAVATISSAGLASGLATGSSTVRATSGSVSGSTSLTIGPADLTSIALTPADPTTPNGTTQPFSATGTYTDATTADVTSSVTWSSSDTAVATITSGGLANSLSTGTTTISATTGSMSGSTALTVLPAALTSIAVTPADPTVPNGTSQQFTATGTYTDASMSDLTSSVTWASSDTSVATVSAAGLATTHALGTTTIFVSRESVVGFTTLTVDNSAPTISDIAEQATAEDTATAAVTFSVGDIETPAADLTVTGNSSNHALVPDARIAFSGSGASRTVTVNPAPDQSGTAILTVAVSDGERTATKTFTLTVAPVNDAPVPVDDPAITDEDTSVDIVVVGNDTDVDNPNADLRAVAVGGVTGGTATVLPDGRTVRFSPTAEANSTTTPGGFSFIYRANDGDLDSATAGTVSITVTAANDAPVATGDPYATDEDMPLAVDAPGVLSNDVDADGPPPLTAALGTGPTHAAAFGLNPDGSFSYTPSANYSGPDAFTYTATDGAEATSAPATVSITVGPVDDADVLVALSDATDPVALGDTYAYTVVVTNGGGDPATNAAAALSLSGTSRVIISATPSQGTCGIGASVTCSLGTIASGASATITVIVEPQATGTITATASASASPPEPNPANNTATGSTTANNAHGCTIIGTAANNTLNGTSGADVICALAGNDTVDGRGGQDIVYAGSGSDIVDGGAGDDTVDGGHGDDIVNGGSGSDTLTDTAGTDRLRGDAGTDSLTTADGAEGDIADGGPNADVCATDPADTRISC